MDALRNNTAITKYMSKKEYFSYGLSTFANGAVVGMTQGYLFVFYIQVLGISVKAAGLMFLIAKIFDGINDPIMGTIVDRTRTRWGKLRPYLIFGSIPLGLILISTFLPLNFLPYPAKIVYIYVTYFSYGIIATLVGVPLWGMAAVMSPVTKERSKIISTGQILSSVGEQSGLVLFSLLVIFTTSSNGMIFSALIIGVLAPFFIVTSALRLKERIEPKGERPSLLDGLKYVIKNKPFFVSTIANLLSFFRNLVSATILLVVSYIFYSPGLQIVFALPGAISGTIGMLIAPLVIKKMSAKNMFIFATILHSVGLGIVYLVGPGYGWQVTAVLMFIAMFPVGMLNIAPPMIAADTLDYWEYKTGQRREGITFAFMGFRSKVSSGLKDFVLAFLLVWAGFEQITSRGLIPGEKDIYFQSQQFEVRLFMIFTLIPAITNLISIIPMFFYKLTGKRLDEIQKALALRKENNKID